LEKKRLADFSSETLDHHPTFETAFSKKVSAYEA
jgi:hypothetical protein